MATQDSELSPGRATDIARDYQSALAQHRAGRLGRAEALYRRLLRRAPDHADALHHLGVIAHQRGRHEEAVELISRSLASCPELADGHLNLGCAWQALGRLDQAAAAFRKAVALKPDLALAHCKLSAVLSAQGEFDAGLESAIHATELMPEFAEAHANRAFALAGQRRFAEAETAYRKALTLQPDRAETLSDLGSVLTLLRRFDEAIECHRRAAALQPNNTRMRFRLAETIFAAGDPCGSETNWRQGLALDPKNAEAWNGLGHTLLAAGRFEDARSSFRRALELQPELPSAYGGLAIIGERAEGEAKLEHLRALVARSECPAQVRTDALFALGLLLDNADRYDEAFACFAQGNALRRQTLADSGARFNLAALQQRVSGLIESCTPDLYATVEGEGNPSEAPVFIVGMPRSGTSLIEQIAASHSRVSGAGELRDIENIADALEAHGRERSAEELDPDLARRLADDYVAHLQRLDAGAARVTDKMPDNIFHLGLIALLFPGARVIFCRRDLRDTCLSCYFHNFDEPIPFARDLVDCAQRALEIERLADYWRTMLPVRMLTIDYEALVADLEGESRRLIEFLGLEWEPACLEFHKTERTVMSASAWQVRQPLFTRSVGRWKRYQRHLGPLLEVLAQSEAMGRQEVSIAAS